MDIKVLWSQTFGTMNAKMKICLTRYLYRRTPVVDIIAYPNGKPRPEDIVDNDNQVG